MSDILAVGKVIKMPAMRRGLCSYSNEMVMLNQNALKELAPTMQGVPVVIEHPDRPITNDSIQDMDVVGRVSNIEYDPSSDDWFVNFIVDKPEAISLLQSGWGVSTAWYGEAYAPGGTHNNVPYDRELLKGRYEHLAIVRNPRYEMAKNPRFLNSCQDDTKSAILNDDTELKIEINTSKGSSMLGKIFRRLITKEEIKLNDVGGEELIVDVEGAEMPLSTLIKEIKDLKANALTAEQRMLTGEHMYDVYGDKKMSSKELVEHYNACMAKNAETPDSQKPEDDEDKKEGEEKAPNDPGLEPKGNEAESEEEAKREKEEKDKKDKKEAEEKAKENARFNALESAHENGVSGDIQPVWLSTAERVELGKVRYGSKK